MLQTSQGHIKQSDITQSSCTKAILLKTNQKVESLNRSVIWRCIGTWLHSSQLTHPYKRTDLSLAQLPPHPWLWPAEPYKSSSPLSPVASRILSRCTFLNNFILALKLASAFYHFLALFQTYSMAPLVLSNPVPLSCGLWSQGLSH